MKNKKKEIEEEPTKWYHYLIILGIIFIIIFTINFFFNYNDDKNEKYTFKYQNGNSIHNIEVFNPEIEIKNFEYEIQTNKFDILSTKKFLINNVNIPKEDLQDVKINRLRFTLYLVQIFYPVFNSKNFEYPEIKYKKINCENSTKKNKKVFFTFSNETKVEFDKKNGCIIFKAKNKNEMYNLVDKFFYEITRN